MKRRLILVITLLTIGNAGGLVRGTDSAEVLTSRVKGIPLRDVAAPLREAWLRFHEADLCLGIDGVFVFQARGMEIWCRVKDERSYQQLAALVEPLRKSFGIELYATRADREKKPVSLRDDDPLPSFWTNAELRMFLRDPFNPRLGSGVDPSDLRDDRGPDPELKRRMKLYGDQILEWENKMVRLATDLPNLARAGYGDDALPDIRNRAHAVCLKHAREVGKCAEKLAESLDHALPRGTKNAPAAKAAPAAHAAAATPYAGAVLVAKQAQDVGARIRQFLYRRAHTVTLADLREPSLIDVLKALRQTVSNFEVSARKSR